VEDGKDEVLSEMYWRREDCCLIVMKSIPLSDSVNNRVLEHEIEHLINLHHPCITTPIGFVLPDESTGSRELKIAELSMEGNSLAEVLLMNPEWWTATVKAKAVAGIALGLRFAHSLGLIHGNLNSSNIIFNSDHCIQIVNFDSFRFERRETESMRGVDVCEFSSEGWTPQMDVRQFGSLLFEIAVGHCSTLPSDANGEGTVRENPPKFVSEMIETIRSTECERGPSFNDIIDILKKNEFRIESAVDSADVSGIVSWVEFCEQSRE
jgi:serine/threonine protein kinase